MRQVGTLPTVEEAKQFMSYLFTVGIETKGEQDGDAWAIWAFDEDRLEEVRKELSVFQEDPYAEKYQNLEQQVAEIVSQRAKEVKAANRQHVSVRKRWERPAWQNALVTTGLIAMSIAVVIVTSSFKESFWALGDKTKPVVTQLTIAPVYDSSAEARKNHNQGLSNIRQGEVWRLITPIFLHFSVIHILFNMMWLRDLGQVIEFRQGSLRFLLMVLVIALFSNLAQYLWSGPVFGGMSGVVYGLFGYLWMKSKYDPASGFYMPPNIIFWMVGFFLIFTFGAFGNIANMAHGVGLAVGMVMGLFRPAMRFLSQK
ncbi:Rhomboid protease GlpG [hydrothermal vent metagenome]|uniref:Rhomboid protease GlpG n=1 Tax=hydrothermal vent metagenome TaxID=652676 RepID=A0A3B1DTA6_9ZZZZ